MRPQSSRHKPSSAQNRPDQTASTILADFNTYQGLRRNRSVESFLDRTVSLHRLLSNKPRALLLGEAAQRYRIRRSCGSNSFAARRLSQNRLPTFTAVPMKILTWDGSGLCLFAKRLERGTFAWPRTDAKSIEYSEWDLKCLLHGIELRDVRERKCLRKSHRKDDLPMRTAMGGC